jgi:colanic acid biosynthesis glycosyl transferase WcaI
MRPLSLRIVIIGLHYAPESTGNAPYTASLAEGLTAAGHDVQVITGYPHYPEWKVRDGYTGWSRRETINGVSVRRVRHFVPSTPNAFYRMHMELSFGFRTLFARWGRPDVVLLVSPALLSTALAMVKARLRPRRPGIGVWVQDIYSRGLVETGTGAMGSVWISRLAARFESFVLSSADGIVAIHERFRQHLVDELGVSASAVTIVRNWTHLPSSPVSDRVATRSIRGWRDDEVIVLHAGNMGKKQGLDNVVEAARRAEVTGSNTRFVLMGDGNQRQNLMTLGRGITNLDFLDSLPQDEFRAAMHGADILLVNELPGVRDMSVPSKLTSYFSTGRPVIAATDEGSVTAGELATSKAGLRVNAGDPDALVRAAEHLGNNPLLGAELGANGVRFQIETLSEGVAIAEYNDFVSSLAESRHR